MLNHLVGQLLNADLSCEPVLSHISFVFEEKDASGGRTHLLYVKINLLISQIAKLDKYLDIWPFGYLASFSRRKMRLVAEPTLYVKINLASLSFFFYLFVFLSFLFLLSFCRFC